MSEEKKYTFRCTVCGWEVTVDTPELPEDFGGAVFCGRPPRSSRVSRPGKRVEYPHGRESGQYVDSCMVVALLSTALQPGVTGFDRVGLRWAAGRGLLATLNRGTVKLN